MYSLLPPLGTTMENMTVFVTDSAMRESLLKTVWEANDSSLHKLKKSLSHKICWEIYM